MRISDWSSDVCSSDLLLRRRAPAETAKASARSPTPARAAEKPFEYVAEIGAAILELEPAALPRTAAKAPRPAAAEAEGRGRIALAVDLAPVEAGALVLVRQPVIGAGDGGNFLRCPRIVLVPVGMQFLGGLPTDRKRVG